MCLITKQTDHVPFLFLIIDLYFYSTAVFAQFFNSAAEPAALVRIASTEAEIETNALTTEAKTSKCSI